MRSVKTSGHPGGLHTKIMYKNVIQIVSVYLSSLSDPSLAISTILLVGSCSCGVSPNVATSHTRTPYDLCINNEELIPIHYMLICSDCILYHCQAIQGVENLKPQYHSTSLLGVKEICLPHIRR